MVSTISKTQQSAQKSPEQALLALEEICLKVNNFSFAEGKNDVDGLTWQRILKNIIAPISIALGECKGPRRFHFHYTHREQDSDRESILHPVEPKAGDVLAHACEVALSRCQNELVGIGDEKIARKARALEHALSDFLQQASVPS